MYFILYKTKNLINHKIYIGIHKSITLEFDGYYGSGILLKLAIKKYGIDNFNREILYIFSSLNEARRKEKEIVDLEFCKRNDTYNISIGGTGGNTIAGHSIEQRQRITNKRFITNKEKGNYVYTGEKLRNAQSRMKKNRMQPNNKHRIHSQSSRRNMSIGKKNKKYKWITNGQESKLISEFSTVPHGWLYGRDMNYKRFTRHSDESKKKISEKIKGDVCYNNGIINLKLKEGQKPPDGFVLGMIQHHKPKMWITDGEQNRLHHPEVEIPEGWRKGRYIEKGKKYDTSKRSI